MCQCFIVAVVATQPDIKDWEYGKISIIPMGKFSRVTTSPGGKFNDSNTTHNSNCTKPSSFATYKLPNGMIGLGILSVLTEFCA